MEWLKFAQAQLRGKIVERRPGQASYFVGHHLGSNRYIYDDIPWYTQTVAEFIHSNPLIRFFNHGTNASAAKPRESAGRRNLIPGRASRANSRSRDPTGNLSDARNHIYIHYIYQCLARDGGDFETIYHIYYVKTIYQWLARDSGDWKP